MICLNMNKPRVQAQAIPLIMTVVTFLVLSALIYGEVLILNLFSVKDIVPHIRISDVLVGLTIYLKTSVDFAIFIGNLMAAYPGWKNRIAIEIGTALGNALGTMIVLALWNFFRNITWLLAIMIFIAALVLFELAEEGIEHAKEGDRGYPIWFCRVIDAVELFLKSTNRITGVVLKYIVPDMSMKTARNLGFVGLFVSSFTIPFILGLDDFAGYVPVFNVVNVLGFSIGVLAGHMILNIFLFISPKKTIQIVKNPYISFAGSLAFIGLAFWGIFEVYKLLVLHHS